MAATAIWPKRGLTALTIAGMGAAIWTASWFWPRSHVRPPAVEEAKTLLPRPVALAPGVYLLGRTSPSAVYAVVTSEGLVLIDSGLDAEAAAVIHQLTELQLDIGRLRAILLTHVHGDHSLGAAHLREQTGAKIYAGRADSKRLREGEPREAFFSTFHMPNVQPHATPVDVELIGDEVIQFGDTRFVAVAAPGHTPGSVCYVLERASRRILFTGDVVQCLTPRTKGAIGTYAAYLPPRYRGNARDYLASLEQLRKLPVPDLVLPGHPRMDPIPQDPHLGLECWQTLLDQGINEMKELLARYEADGADFLDGTPKELLPGLHYLGDIEQSAIYCLASSQGLFLFDAPGGPSLVDFLSARFNHLGWDSTNLTAVLLTSAHEDATGGLEAIVKTTGCKVVAPKNGAEAIRRTCPPGTQVLTEEDLAELDWFEVRAIPLRGRGLDMLAYVMRWADTTVLVSGRIRVKPSVPAIQQLHADLLAPGGSVTDYLHSLDDLAPLNPGMWLPAMPVHGQNANLYDGDWAEVIAQNRQLFR